MVIASKHSKKRKKERLGINKSSADRQAQLAFERGLKHGDMTGSLHSWVSHIAYRSRHNGASKFILYNKRLFVFTPDYELVKTILYLPPHLKKSADAQMKKHKEKLLNKELV